MRARVKEEPSAPQRSSLRIGFFVPRCTPENSHGRYVIELAKRLAGHHQVAVYSGAVWPPLRTRVRYHFLPVLDRPMVARLATLWTASVLTVAWRRFDIVHIQGADAPVGNVVTAHYCNAALREASSEGESFRRRLNYALGAVVERSCLTKPSTRRVIAVSAKLREELVTHYGVDPERIKVIHHGVDLERFSPRDELVWRKGIRDRLGLADSDFVVLFIGGDYKRKGLLPLLEAIRAIESPITVAAVGVTPDRFLAGWLHQNGLHARVVIIGPTREIAPYYAAADCFALPTRYDTFSLASLEAMASGLPVLVSRAAGVSELITDGVDGLLLDDPWDIGELVAKLSRLAGDVAFRVSLSENARKTASQHTWDQVVERTLLVYRQALEAER